MKWLDSIRQTDLRVILELTLDLSTKICVLKMCLFSRYKKTHKKQTLKITNIIYNVAHAHRIQTL